MAQPEDRPYLTPDKSHCRTCGQLIVDPPTAKCEHCGKETPSKPLPTGWQQRGKSKHGTSYQRKGVAWWCHDCLRFSVAKSG